MPSVAFPLPPELLVRPGGVAAGQHGVERTQHKVGPPEDRDYREVSVSSTGAVQGQRLSEGERIYDELPGTEAVVPVL